MAARRRSRWARSATRSPGGSRAALERFVYARSTARVVALSPGIRAALPPGRSVLIPNAADLDLFAPAPPPDEFLVSYFGTLGEANDVTAAVEAARLLPDVRFVIMGDGKRRAELERSAPAERGVPARHEGGGGAAGRRVERLPDALQGRARARHELAEQALRHLRGGPAGDREHGRLDARAGGATTRRACTCAPATRPTLAEKLAWLRDNPDVAERMGRNARALAEREFGRDELAARALAVLEEAAR